MKYTYRSAITGRFVSEKYAKKHQKTTVREKIKNLFAPQKVTPPVNKYKHKK